MVGKRKERKGERQADGHPSRPAFDRIGSARPALFSLQIPESGAKAAKTSENKEQTAQIPPGNPGNGAFPGFPGKFPRVYGWGVGKG